jgi:hypothetical protein
MFILYMNINNKTTDYFDDRFVHNLANQVDKSSVEVEEQLSSLKGKIALWLTGLKEDMPDWAMNYIDLYKQLEQAILKIKSSGDNIPGDILKSYQQGQETLKKLAEKVNAQAYLHAITPKEPTVDKHGLLLGNLSLPTSLEEWHLNLGLLMNVYNSTKDASLKKKIEFLALNYLAKAAPVNIKELGLGKALTSRFDDLFQYGPMTEPMSYHREHSAFERILEKGVSSTFAQSSQGWFWLTDTTQFSDFLPLQFQVISSPKALTEQQRIEEWSKDLSTIALKHWECHAEDSYHNSFDPPILFDFTDLLAELITTHGEASKEQEFIQKKEEIEKCLEASIHRAVQQLKEKKPDIFKTLEDEAKFKVLMKFNMICICRCELKKDSKEPGVAVLKKLDFFEHPNHFALPDEIFADKVKFLHLEKDKTTSSYFARQLSADRDPWAKGILEAFINHTGLRIGAVSGREKIFNFFSLNDLLQAIDDNYQMTEYAVRGENAIYFPERDSILKTEIFKRFQAQIRQHSEHHPEVAILGQATLQILLGLSKEISLDKWAELNANPDTRMILQQNLYRLMTHLTAAENHILDYTQFSQAIELIHSEIGTILALCEPFKKEDFEQVYKDRLKIIPDSLRSHLKVGIAKSAMNAFAGINVAVNSLHAPPERVYGENAYFEEVAFVGDNRSLDKVFKDESLKSIDLYVGEFNHNVNIQLEHKNYSQGNIIQDIELLLQKKTETQHLTVAIDFTIDYVNSPQAKKLLEHFSKETTEGKLNFVFFASGQKFDMLGLDSYYGAPFWMVNNGAKTWEAFDALRSHEAYQTDPLTLQWFCLANKYAPQQLDLYKKQIFDNTREILDHIPEELKPDGSPDQQIRINTVDKQMLPAFIDIKILNDTPEKTSQKIQQLLYRKFGEQGLKIHSRGSFGFYHPNFNIIASIDDKRPRNVRINPGLNPKENALILEFIKEIPKVL